ncbi:PREDICTED: prokineticin receptor 2-like [Branchiostoma belcheri]|uniref:Prokineticin receptor 2-like n=1 Tax=Branchiostoma belcheri TaxID=7741 RepID=A0A6P4Y8L3_BRABE|nr:PREDICTED: prokineticin receptor 2-like [Branchiostoma belcheri]
MDSELESLYPTDHPLLEHITGTYSPHSFNMTSCLHYLSQNYNHTASNSFQDILSQIPSYCQQLLLEAAAMDTHAIHPDLEAAKASTVIRTVLGIVYSLVMAVCGFGNLLLLLVIFCYKKSRSATNMLISNLCFADFCVAVFCIPLQLDYYVIRNQDWMWGGSMCKVVSFIRMLSLYVSTNTLLVISIDRCLVVRRQFNGKKTRRSVAVVLAVVWTVSALVALPSALYAKTHPQRNSNHTSCVQAWPVSQIFAYKAYFMFLMVAEYVVPSLCMALCLLFVWCKVWGRRFPGTENASIRRAREKSRKKTIHLLILVIMFVVCWTPYYTYSLVRDFFDVLQTYHLKTDLFYIAEVFAKSNSMINTVAYIVFNENIMMYVRSLAGFLRAHLGRRRRISRYGSQPTVKSSLRRRPMMVEVEMAVLPPENGSSPRGKVYLSPVRTTACSVYSTPVHRRNVPAVASDTRL